MKSTRQSKSSHIYKVLKEEIVSGKYKPDDLFYSETMLIKRFEVSRPTTIRVLNDLQNEKLIVRRAGSGTYVSAPPQEKTGNWGLMMGTSNVNQNLHPMIGQLLATSRKINKSLIIGNHTWAEIEQLPQEEQLTTLFQPFQQAKIEGLFFVPFYDPRRQMEANTHENLLNPFNQFFLDHLRAQNIPVVFLEYGMKAFPFHSDHDLVTTDHFLGGYMQGQHLLQKPIQSAHFLCTESLEFIPSVHARREGLIMALQEKGLTLKSHHIDPQEVAQVKSFVETESPDAIIAANDTYAAKLINTFFQLGVSVPDQVQVVGFDNNPISEFSVVPITTVQQPFSEIAEVATKMLSDRIAGLTTPPVSILLKPQMIVRKSSP